MENEEAGQMTVATNNSGSDYAQEILPSTLRLLQIIIQIKITTG
ncbi:hypothetical protein [Thiolapillus sp.]